eukprot:457799-Alexandrium_andersonii.AAC.1
MHSCPTACVEGGRAAGVAFGKGFKKRPMKEGLQEELAGLSAQQHEAGLKQTLTDHDYFLTLLLALLEHMICWL